MPKPSHAEDSMMRCDVLIMAGGTGGHIFPGVALAQELLDRGHSVAWLGCKDSMEAQLVPQHGIAFHTIEISGVRGKGLLTKLKAPFSLLRSCLQAMAQVKVLAPKIVVGFGGFVAAPGGLAARLLRLPLFIHEQNAVAGTTNKLLARFSQRVFTAFPHVFPRGEWIGNPIRRSLKELADPSQRKIACDDTRKILVLGGSRGARFLNLHVPALMQTLGAKLNGLSLAVTHQCGKGHKAKTQQAYREAHFDSANVVEFIDDIDVALAKADLVICRAGASTVTELCAVGVGSLLVPFPYAIDDHQTSNAEFAVAKGAAMLQQESGWANDELAKSLSSVLESKERLLDMAQKARSARKVDAAPFMASACESVISFRGDR